jgi:hypothetical protein
MPGRIGQFLAERWRFGILKTELTIKELIDELNTRLGRLSETLERIHSAAEDGPFPGSYLTLTMTADVISNQTGLSQMSLANEFDPDNLVFAFRPVGCGAMIAGYSVGQVDVMVQYLDRDGITWTDLLVNPHVLDQTIKSFYDEQVEFTGEYIVAKALRLNTSNVAGTPVNLNMTLFVKNVKKIEKA